MEEEAEYGINAGTIARLIIGRKDGWSIVKQGIRAAASEVLLEESDVYHAAVILNANRPG